MPMAIDMNDGRNAAVHAHAGSAHGSRNMGLSARRVLEESLASCADVGGFVGGNGGVGKGARGE